MSTEGGVYTVVESETTSPTQGVYRAIRDIQEELSRAGIGKERENKTQGFKFRGIDDVYAALSPLLAKHNLVILPRVLDHTATERQSKSGGTLITTVVDCEFDLVCSTDGSIHTIRTCGEGMDSGDKGTNKAMSAAYKYAAFMAFCIPVEGMVDADAESHDVMPAKKPAAKTPVVKESTPVDDTATRLAALKKRVFAVGNSLNINAAAIKTLSIDKLHKESSKEWTISDMEYILGWMQEQDINNKENK